MLTIDGLTKTYRGGVRANDDVHLRVGAGEVYGLLGHNGAGKTTLVNQVVGLVAPDAGTIVLDGHDLVADPGLARRLCSIQPQAQVPITGLTPRRAIELTGRLRGGRADAMRRRTAALADALDIGEWMDTDAARLSGGVKRLTSFAMAAVAPGRLVILDEPTNDVDPVRRRLLWAQVRALADAGSGVLLVTHNVVEAERSVDRLAILDRGRVVVEGTPVELKSSVAGDLRLDLTLEPGGDPPTAPAWAVRSVRENGHRMIVTVPAARAGDAAGWALAEQRAGRVEEFGLAPATLEDAYVALVGGAGPADTADAADAAGPAGVATEEVRDDRAA
jgi:ABC-2 type transport system ATP-binding protein